MTEKDLRRLTLAQFEALAERYREEQRVMDYRSAIVCSLIAEVNRDRRRRPKPFSPDDFMPKIRERASNKKVSEALRRINRMLGGEEK